MPRALMARALKLLGTGAAATRPTLSPAVIAICIRHYRKPVKFVDPFAYPKLYLGDKPLLPTVHDPGKEEATKKREGPKKSSNNRIWRGMKKTQFVNAERRRKIAVYKANLQKRDADRRRHWGEAAKRAKEWKAEALSILGSKKPMEAAAP